MKPSLLTLALISAFAAAPAYAADETQPENAAATNEASSEQSAQASQNLQNITIRAAPFAQKMGTQRITSRQIATRPYTNGTITDLMLDNPNVQFSNISGTSEIAPENVSFHGEKFYNNNWQIDGMSNTDNSNPGAGAGYQNSNDSDMDGLPNGGAQSFWVNADIIDSVDVYDSNISAKYGQFTGGVVDAKFKDPSSKKASGSVSFRTSRSSWMHYHAETDIDATKEQQGNYYQPEFTKYIWGLNLNQPINDRAALMFSYNRTQFNIQFYHTVMKQKEDQKRPSQVFVLKGVYRFDNGDALKATAMYSPHESKYLRTSTKAGAYTNSGGGYRFNLEWKHLFDKGQVSTYLGVQSTRNRVENEADYHISYSLSKRLPSTTAAGTNPRCATGAVCEPNHIPSWLDWVSTLRTTNESAGRYYPDLAGKIGDPAAATYGGYGTFETTRKSLVAKQDYLFPDLEWGKTKHTLAFGWSAEWAQARYKRFNDVYNYTGSPARSTSGIACLAGDHGCIEGQYFTTRDYYPARSVKVGNNHYALYFEDKINWGNWEITPGIRIDHDRFLKYTDFAPRFTATWDVFGNGDTRLFGGVNRYYAQSVLAQKLKKNIGSGYRQSRSLPTTKNGVQPPAMPLPTCSLM